MDIDIKTLGKLHTNSQPSRNFPNSLGSLLPEADGGSPAEKLLRGRKVRAPKGREVANGDPG